MTTTSDIPNAILGLLKADNGLPSQLEIIERKEKDIDNDIDAALGRLNAVVFILPVKPLRITEGADFIFFESAEVRLRMIINPTTTDLAMESSELSAKLRLALHGKNPGDLLADNIRLANPPLEEVEDPEVIIHDNIFLVSYHESA